MSQIIPIYIPTYISDATYAPARVLPRLLFYNGKVDSETWYMESGSLAATGQIKTQTAFPYFDNYNVVTGSFPTEDSRTLLFNNEAPSYGSAPTASLYTEYWEDYISLLYNPKTRLLNCSAIIPLADYVKMELNDIVNFRGNYYHLRAINDYSLKDGTCNLQLLGPIIPDAIQTEFKPIFEWYKLVSCSGSVTYYTDRYDAGTFTTGSIVTTRLSGSATAIALTVTEALYDIPTGSLISITGSSWTSCPPDNVYYDTRQCNNNVQLYSKLYPFGTFDIGKIFTTQPITGTVRTTRTVGEVATLPFPIPPNLLADLTASVLTQCP